MNRRKFLKNISLASVSALAFNSIPLNTFASRFVKLALTGNSDRVLIFIQLHGGNDGLNTVIPLNQYSEYYNVRPNIALPYTGSRQILTLDSTLPDIQLAGIHPDMVGFKEMYDAKKAAVVQNVGYENTSMSHFRGRDIYFMGGGYNDYFDSGWLGRFLEDEYPGYPDSYPNTDNPDPLAIEFGNNATLALHREEGIPSGIAISNPEGFFDLVNSVGGNYPDTFPDSYYGNELEYLTSFERKTNQYAERLQQVYTNGTNSPSIVYPTKYPLNAPPQYSYNGLSEQLRIVARLLSGGIKTRIFLVRLTGFDTHASQVETYDTSMGRHAALLYHLSSATKAFFDDLKLQNLDEKVVGMTYSEFGRRVYSNAGYGSDHGKAQPVLLFGPGLKGGVYGENPDLNNLDGGNLRYTVDYRRVYASVLMDWFGASETAMNASMFGEHINNRLDLFSNPLSSKSINSNGSYELNVFPNPAVSEINVQFTTNAGSTYFVAVYNMQGALVSTLGSGKSHSENCLITFNISGLSQGSYICSVVSDSIKRNAFFQKL